MVGDNNQQLLENTYRSSFGLQNGNFNTTGSFSAKNICAIQVLSATATITSLTEAGGNADTSFAGITYNQGMIIYGNFTAGVIATGAVRCYSFNPQFT